MGASRMPGGGARAGLANYTERAHFAALPALETVEPPTQTLKQVTFLYNTPMSGRNSSVEKALSRALRMSVSQKNTFWLLTDSHFKCDTKSLVGVVPTVKEGTTRVTG